MWMLGVPVHRQWQWKAGMRMTGAEDTDNIVGSQGSNRDKTHKYMGMKRQWWTIIAIEGTDTHTHTHTYTETNKLRQKIRAQHNFRKYNSRQFSILTISLHRAIVLISFTMCEERKRSSTAHTHAHIAALRFLCANYCSPWRSSMAEGCGSGDQ